MKSFVSDLDGTHYGVRCLDFYKQPIYSIIIILDRNKTF